MKIEHSYCDRAYAANLFRRRATELRDLAAKKSKLNASAQVDLEGEATYCDARAVLMDRGGDDPERPEPITANPNADIDAVGKADAPTA